MRGYDPEQDFDLWAEDMREAADLRRKEMKENPRCVDCGEDGELTGHMGCQYPQDH